MARRGFLAATGIAALAFVACSGDAAEPDAGVSVTGVVADEAGAPVVGATVSARPHLAAQEIDTSRLAELDALGFACIDDRPPPACDEGDQRERTGDDGRFTVTFGTEDLGGAAAVVAAPTPLTIAATHDPADGQVSGPATSGQLLFAGDEQLPPMVLWNPALTLETTNGADAALRWDHPPAVAVSEYRVLVEDSDGRLVWQEATDSLEVVLRLPNLSGTRGAVSVVAVASDGPERYRSARIAYRADEGHIRAATIEEIDWPSHARLSPAVVLGAIVSLLVANLMMVITAGVRHRRQLELIPVRSARPRRR